MGERLGEWPWGSGSRCRHCESLEIGLKSEWSVDQVVAKHFRGTSFLPEMPDFWLQKISEIEDWPRSQHSGRPKNADKKGMGINLI